MNTDKKHFSSLTFLLVALSCLAALFVAPNNLRAEGSVDFTEYDGYRLFYFAERPQQLKVYASEGEFINFGASHVGISSGFIKVYRPDGTLHSTYNNTGTSAGLGIINNNIEEANGPNGGGSTQGLGYTPGIVQVDPGEQGVWTISLGYGFYQNSGFDNLLNNQAWTRDADQPTNRRVVLSWDITVSQNSAANEGGNTLTGRVFTNEYQSIISSNGNTTSPTFYLLTNEGLQFQIDYQDVDPWGFQINSNNKGIITGDNVPTYASFELNEVTRSAEIATFDADKFYLYEPQARDTEGIINNKVFFNLPDPNMPAMALVTDIVRGDSQMTWLYNEAPEYEIEIIDVNLLSNDPAANNGVVDVLDRSNGALITYSTNLGGNAQLVIDIDNDGIFGNNQDRVINAAAITGENQILWDGLDRDGVALPQQFNRALSYQLRINAGEIHLTLSDIENDLGGVRLTRLNGNAPSDQFLYDHSRLGEAISGNNLLPLPTSEPFTFSNNFGDLKMLDYWTYVSSVSTISELLLDIVDDISLLAPDTDGDGIRDDNDIDDDNDGILDEQEACPSLEGNGCIGGDFDPAFDNDFDGIPNYLDASDAAFSLDCQDANNDGVCDKIIFELDIDQDGVPNHLDLDADNDGIVDIIEANHNIQDTDGNGTIDAAQVEFGKNGLFNPLGTDRDLLTAQINYQFKDTDNDQYPDAYDLDSDNDGLFDVGEVNLGQYDTTHDGMLSENESNITINARGLVSPIDIAQNGNQIIFPIDSDGDLIYNFRDRDSDNDGLSDVLESRNPDIDGDGIVGDGEIEISTLGLPRRKAGRPFVLQSNIPDHDNDGVEDYRDLDADNDGIYDVAEALLEDLDNDGFFLSGSSSVDAFGMVIADGASTANYLSAAPDMDGDMIENFLDRDSDNDGIHDITEGGNEDPDGDGVLTLVNSTDVNQFGIVNAGVTSSLVSNNDMDMFPDYLDLDADNDGINDVIEAGFVDVNNDGKLDTQFNSYGQSLNDNNEIASTSFPKDHDNDGVPNYHDLDSDNDGLNDVVEGGGLDEDNDGIIGVGNPITGEDGRVLGQGGASVSTSYPLDTDQDGIFDYEDLDSDNDGIFDVYESNLSDEDNDGIIGVGNIEVDENGQVILDGQIINTSNPLDTDGDGIPDFRDLDSDNDELTDNEECPDGAPCPDVNQLGGPDYIEFSPLACPTPLVQPTVEHASSICSNEMLSLEVNEASDYEAAYPGQDITYTWRNANGVVIATTTNEIFEILGDDPMLVLPLTVKVSVDVDCESDDSNAVSPEIKPTPNAVASTELESICAGGEVRLFAESVPNASYQWLFGTFPFSSNQNPLLNSLGTTTSFGLIVTVDGCESEDNVVVTVQEPPAIEALDGAGDYCAGEDVTFTAINNNTDLSGNLNYVFSGPDGLMVDISVPADGTFEYTVSNVDFVNGGSYSLFVDMGPGCSSNIENYNVVVSEGPEQPVMAVNDDSVCEGENIALSTQMYQGSNVSYVWMLDGVMVSTTSTPSYTVNAAAPANAGNYTVQVNTGGCGASTSAPIAVNVVDTSISPEVESSLGTASACTGQTVNLKVINPTPETIYTWFNPDGVMIGMNVLEVDIMNIQLADAGTYSVEANIDGCVTLQDQEEIQVAEGLAVPELDNTNIQVCQGQNVEIVVTNFGGSNNTVFNWYDSNDMLIAQTTDPSVIFQNVSNSNNYYVLVEQGDCTSGASLAATVVVNNPPNEIANAGLNESYCLSDVINLNATLPAQGTGTWINSTATFADENNPNTVVSNLSLGSNMFIWVLNANGCMDYSRDTVIVEISDVPNETASIQNTQSVICASDAANFQLLADAPVESDGEWTFAGNPNGITFTDPFSPSTGVENASVGTYEVIWSLSTISCGVYSENSFTFTIENTPTDIANAGSNQSFCDGALVTTQANTPSLGFGTWTSDTGIVFADPNDPNTTVTGLSEGTNVLTWSLSTDGCPDYNTDQITIDISSSPNEQAAVAENTITICEGSSLDLLATMPNLADGNWNQVAGPSATIMNTNSIQTGVNYSGPGSYTFVWQLSTADCGTFSTAEVEVLIEATPNETANAGNDQDVCGTEASLSALQSIGNGFWTSTVGDIQDPTDPNTTVANLPIGSHTFTWTLSNGVCQNYASDQVTITISDLPNDIAEAVNNQISLCADASNGSTNLVAIEPTSATGSWIQMSGPNTVSFSDNTEAITEISGLLTGVYQFSWSLSSGSCMDFSSDMVTVSVDEVPANEVAEAGQNQSLCSSQTTNLGAAMPSIGTGRWSIINTSGASVEDVMDPNSTVNLVEGENIFVWSLSNGGCTNYQTDTVSVFLTTPDDNAVILTENIEICESDVNSITLAANQVNTATGVWVQTAGPNTAAIDNAANQEINVTNVVPGTYTFQWTLSEGNCLDYDSDAVNVSISALPNEEAGVAQDEYVLCDDNQITIEAITPTSSVGVWTANGSATIATADSPTTMVDNLEAGQNTLTWSLSNGACQNFSETMISIFVEEGIEAVDDSYTTPFATMIENESLIDNENFNGNTDWNIQLVGSAPEVSINEDGTFTFVPATGFSGEYTFQYEICDMSCNTCERALVKINVEADAPLLCDIPNVLTPNNDNKNDVLRIDCTSQFQNNIIQVFNRWGDKVYEKNNYQSDWGGTFDGDDLPAGTYFYVFKKDQNETEAITGYITIIR